MGVILTISKVFTISFSVCLWGQGISWQLSKQIGKLLFQMSVKIYSLLRQFGRGSKVWGEQEHFVVITNKKVLPFVKFGIISSLLYCSLDPLTNKYCWAWMISLLDRFQDMSRERCHRGESLVVTQSYQEKMYCGI